MPAGTPNPNHEPQDNLGDFDRIINQTEWSDEAIILDTPTPLDNAASADQNGNPEEAQEQRSAVLAGLEEVIAETDDGKGLAVFNGLSNISFNEEARQKFERVGMEHTPRPPKFYRTLIMLQPLAMVNAFPNPGDLIAAYSEKREELEQSGMASSNEITDMLLVDKFLRVVYGDRYDVFQETLENAQDASAEEADASSAEPIVKASGAQELRDKFSSMVDQGVWSDEAKERSILGIPTPIDIAASDEVQINPLEEVQRRAVETRLREVVATFPEADGDAANRGMAMLNALTHEATNKLDGGPAPHEGPLLPYLKDANVPVGYFVVRMVKAFPNPGDLIDTYIERHKGEHEGKPSDEWVDQEAMDEILGAVYGKRYEVYKAIREAEKSLFDRVIEGVEQGTDETEKVSRGVRRLGWGALRSSGLAIRNRVNDAKDRVKAVKRRRNKRKAKRQ